MVTPIRTPRARRGTIVPFLAIALVGLFGFVALAIDLGLLMVARGQDQNAVDAAALAGTRLLDNKPTSVDSNRAAAVAAANDVLANNYMLNTTNQTITVAVGVYDYNTTTQTFEVTYPSTPPPGRSWTAFKVEVVGSHTTYFAKVFGITSMQTGATAVAVHRPRDIAVVLDMTGSMRFGSSLAANSVYLSCDPLYPQMGHYQRFTETNRYVTNNPSATRPNPFFTTAGWVNPSSGELWAPNNYTERTAGGPAVVKDFCYDPQNLANPSNLVVTPNPNMTNPTLSPPQPPLPNAFHHWDPLVTGIGNPDAYLAPTYNFAGWPYATTQSFPNLYPTPEGFKDQSDPNFAPHGGDRWPRKRGAERSVAVTTTWDPVNPSGSAITLMEYLGWAPGYSSGSSLPLPSYPIGRTAINFRDAAWERYGYDLDVEHYIAERDKPEYGDPWDPRWDWDIDANGGSGTWVHQGAADDPPGTTFRPRRRTGTTFRGYTLGPGYWGKTFFIWPPDPRADKDWRRKFFLRGDSTPFDPQADNAGTGGIQHINELLLTNSTGHTLLTAGSNTYRVNYDAILAWIKSPPMCVPPNLRSGRVVYYTSIPNNVDTTSGSNEERLDKAFWKSYIDFVLRTTNINSSENRGWPEGVLPTINGLDLTQFDATGIIADPRPYLPYADNPSRPRSQFWFGPITLIAYLASARGNMWSGTVHESQNWQLKAGMQSAMDDIRNNHPNDSLGMAFFSYIQYGNIAVALGQDWTASKRALFYPLSLLNANQLGDPSREYRPYDLSMNYQGESNIPNAQSGTDPNTGLAMGFNILSPSPDVPLPPRPDTTSPTAPRNGRRGASKIVIFETDGVPNSYRTLSFVQTGWRSYYQVTGNGANAGNGSQASIDAALSVVDQIVLQMAPGTTGTSGLSSPNSPARVYAIGFGDLFSTPSATFQPTARQFLLDIQKRGGTSAATDTALPDYQIITGGYQTRIDGLRTAFERILQSGVQVTLIE